MEVQTSYYALSFQRYDSHDLQTQYSLPFDEQKLQEDQYFNIKSSNNSLPINVTTDQNEAFEDVKNLHPFTDQNETNVEFYSDSSVSTQCENDVNDKSKIDKKSESINNKDINIINQINYSLNKFDQQVMQPEFEDERMRNEFTPMQNYPQKGTSFEYEYNINRYVNSHEITSKDINIINQINEGLCNINQNTSLEYKEILSKCEILNYLIKKENSRKENTLKKLNNGDINLINKVKDNQNSTNTQLNNIDPQLVKLMDLKISMQAKHQKDQTKPNAINPVIIDSRQNQLIRNGQISNFNQNTKLGYIKAEDEGNELISFHYEAVARSGYDPIFLHKNKIRLRFQYQKIPNSELSKAVSFSCIDGFGNCIDVAVRKQTIDDCNTYIE